jgi:hypothetical protein
VGGRPLNYALDARDKSVLDLLVSFVSLRHWRALFAWLMTAAIIYPIITYVPNPSLAFYSSVAIGVTGFVAGLYWEHQCGRTN